MSTSADPSLLVGLGNPGSKYSSTRHNVGFMVLEKLATKECASFSTSKKLFGQLAEIGIGAQKRRLLMPDTYMNESGRAVQAAMHWFGLQPNHILIIVDDIDLPLGKLRLRYQGGAGGHNGLKSIINNLGTQNFSRLRVGIGKPVIAFEEKQVRTVSHVLGAFNSKEQLVMQSVLNEVVLGLNLIQEVGLEKAANHLNSMHSKFTDI